MATAPYRSCPIGPARPPFVRLRRPRRPLRPEGTSCRFLLTPRTAGVALGLALVALAPSAAGQPWVDVGGALGLPSQATPLGGSNLVAATSLSDLDGDGDLDVIRSGGSASPRAYLRGANGLYTVAAGLLPGLDQDGETSGHTVFDMDGDGDRDVLVVREGKNRLFENLGGGAFVDASEGRLPGIEGWGSSATAGDLDGDGDLDVVVARYIDRVDFPVHRCLDNLLFENVGGRFVDRSDDAGFGAVRGCSFTSLFVDVDDDLDLDVIVINDFAQFVTPQELWINQGGLRFVERAGELGLVAPNYGMGVAAGDVDEDARLDLVVTNIGEPVALERQDDGRFADALAPRGLDLRFAAEQLQASWTARFEDLDADGWLDLVMASGYLPAAPFIATANGQTTAVFRGGADGRLAPYDAALGLSDPDHNARDVHFEDLDGDGRLEIVLGHVNGRVGVYRSAAPRPASTVTTIRLAPSMTGSGAAGASVRATACGVLRRRWVTAGGGYGNADRGVVHMAWPACADGQAVSGTVRWPSGLEEAFTTTVGATLTLLEPRWLTIEAGVVTADLRTHSGIVAELTFGGAGLQLGASARQGRVWSAPIALAAGVVEAQLDVRLDGRVLGAHPRLAAPAPSLAHAPSYPVIGEAVVVTTDAGARVVFAGDEALTDDDGRATFSAPDTPGDYPLEVWLGEAVARRTVRVGRAADEARSELTARDLHIAVADVPTTMARLRLWLRDANHRPAALVPEDLGVLVDGEARAPASVVDDGEYYTVRVFHGDLHDGALLQATVFGEPWFEPVRVAQVDDLLALGALVDPARSVCALSEPRLWSGVGDRGTVVVVFNDAYGVRLSDLGTLPSWLPTGATIISGSVATTGAIGASAGVSVGAGPASVTVTVPGQTQPIGCDIAVGPRPTTPPIAAATVRLTGATPIEIDSERTFTIVPLAASGRAVGAGVAFTLEADDGDVTGLPLYTGFGRYEARVTARSAPQMTVRVRAGGVIVASMTYGVHDPGEVVADPEPGAEEAPEGEAEAPPEEGPADEDAVEVVEDLTDGDQGGGDTEDAAAGADAEAETLDANDGDAAAEVAEDVTPADVDTTEAPVEPSPEPEPEPAVERDDDTTLADGAAEATPDTTRRGSDDGCATGHAGVGAAWLVAALVLLGRRARIQRAGAPRGLARTRGAG